MKTVKVLQPISGLEVGSTTELQDHVAPIWVAKGWGEMEGGSTGSPTAEESTTAPTNDEGDEVVEATITEEATEVEVIEETQETDASTGSPTDITATDSPTKSGKTKK